ncbi:MAG: lytic transglycosylase domain-containing protein [Deltaproteobacteria bacterium]|jgi:soluble lytic murein transglycosylase|nr:lytic transglycosylase domain-containing protein [Deltaproteobacteria bacterium]
MKNSLLFLLSIIPLFFQNFLISNMFDKKLFIDEKSRKNHAKEVLGNSYHKSSASKLEGEKFFHIYLFDIVQSKLPIKYKQKAKEITKSIIQESKKFQIDPLFVVSLIFAESSFNPEARGLAGEIGLMQLMPTTGKEVAKRINVSWKGSKTLKDPVKNIIIGTAYLGQLRGYFENSPPRYISAYNSGPGRIKKIEKIKDLPHFYSTKILKHYENFYKKMASNKVPDSLAFN